MSTRLQSGNIEGRSKKLFRQLSRLRRYERILVEIVVFERGGSLWAPISWGMGVAHQRISQKPVCFVSGRQIAHIHSTIWLLSVSLEATWKWEAYVT